jgi:hypothetical protein
VSAFTPVIRRRQGAGAPDSRLYDEIQQAFNDLQSGITDGVLAKVVVPKASFKTQTAIQFNINNPLGRTVQMILQGLCQARYLLSLAPTQPTSGQIALIATAAGGDVIGPSAVTIPVWVF